MIEDSKQQVPLANTANSPDRQRPPRRKVLTDAMVATLPRRAQPYFHPDPELPKHGVRVRPTGPGAYTVITRDPFGKQRWTKVGSTAEIAIAEARDIARTVIRRVRAAAEAEGRQRRRRHRRMAQAPRREGQAAQRRRVSPHRRRIHLANMGRARL